jgi:branched-chain amino acid aminotransferase
MPEIAEAANEGRLLEIFGAGTAAVVSPVRKIAWKGQIVNCGLDEHSEAGPIAQQMMDWMGAIQYGEEAHPWRYVWSTVIREFASDDITVTRSSKKDFPLR